MKITLKVFKKNYLKSQSNAKLIITDGAFEKKFKKFDPTQFSTSTSYDIRKVFFCLKFCDLVNRLIY